MRLVTLLKDRLQDQDEEEQPQDKTGRADDIAAAALSLARRGHRQRAELPAPREALVLAAALVAELVFGDTAR